VNWHVVEVVARAAADALSNASWPSWALIAIVSVGLWLRDIPSPDVLRRQLTRLADYAFTKLLAGSLSLGVSHRAPMLMGLGRWRRLSVFRWSAVCIALIASSVEYTLEAGAASSGIFLSITKTPSTPTYTGPGQTVNYTYVITNHNLGAPATFIKRD